MSNVSVCVRLRPLNTREVGFGSEAACICRTDHESFIFKDEKEEEAAFSFDRIFYEDSTQADVFEFVAMPIVKDAMNAINGTVLAYGQTGAGKTHSMEGPNMQINSPLLKGILPRVAQCIFEFIEDADEISEFTIKLSMVEIYMEKIRDLLDSTKDNLQVKENKAQGIFVAGATESYIQTEEEMLRILQAGVANRAVGATQMNAGSSRSHCVFLVTIQQTNIEDRSVKTGKLYLVDLAGSEKVEKTGAEGRILCEAKTINKSLSALGNVINALTAERTGHIPYRDSKLTRILQESLGGNSRTTLLCCCSPSSLHASETLSTLRFGTRAKQLKNKPQVNAERGRHEIEQLLRKADQECEKLRGQVLILNARLRSLDQETGMSTETVTSMHSISPSSNVANESSPDFLEKLKLMLSKKSPPTLDDIINVLKDLFIEEGLILDLPSTYDLVETPAEKGVDGSRLSLLEEETTRTLTFLQKSVEDLMEDLDKLTRENEGLKMELLACVCLSKGSPGYCIPLAGSMARGRSLLGKPQVVRPVRGGSHGTCEAGSAHAFTSEPSCTQWSFWKALSTKPMQTVLSLLRRA